MSLFTSSALTSRASVAFFLAIFVLLGGLASLHTHGDLSVMSDPQRSKVASARSIAQDVEFSWDMVRIRVRLVHMYFNRRTIAFALKRT